MKKRILSAIIMSALVLSMTACGTSTDAPDTANSADVTTAAAAETETTAAEEEKTEAATTTAEETEATTTTTEAPKVIPKITKEPKICDGCLILKIDDKQYLYNITDNTMTEYDFKDTINYANGKVAQLSDYYYNLETNEKYDVKTFYNWVSDYNPVYKIEKDFDGDKYYFGILDNNGEWALPLSSEYAICDIKPNRDIYGGTTSLLKLGYDGAYDWKNDKLFYKNEFGNKKFYSISDDYILLTDSSSLSAYNTTTGETTSVYNGAATYANFLASQLFVVVDSANEYFSILGDGFKKLYEIKGYETDIIYNASESYVVFPSKGSSNSKYIVILDKDGNRVVDPIEGDANLAYVSGDYVVLADVNYYDEDDKFCTSDFIVNCKTGEIKEYADKKTYDIIYCYGETGKMIVKSDGAYYLADVSDLDTLINPFEIAE
ncbi:MAG: hypothetical protein IJF18_01010 [Oscillospiraceae bacterium]|nr:hypothetical protein [Oscillospiraceae bacterium]